MTNNFVFEADLAAKKINVVRLFKAPVEKVWKAWTKKEILDQWWGPKPYKVETKAMDFREGGFWLYCMVGPAGDRHWSMEKYKEIITEKMITNFCSFCDEEGKESSGYTSSIWKKVFTPAGDSTEVHVELSFDKESDIEAMLKMGFEAGFTAGLNNLDEYLAVS